MDTTVNQAAGSVPLGNTGTFENNYSSTNDTSTTGSNPPSGAVDSVKQAVSSRVQAGTEWLKERDIEQVKQTLETQVREHPVRTLLVALGAGYLLGKALRR
jgi:hypothetical protein